MFKWFIAFIMFNTPLLLQSQLNTTIENYTEKQGLQVSETFTTTATSDRKIWIASNEGIISFNGHNFSNFTHQLADSSSFSNNYCKTASVDGQDKIWVAADDYLNVFNSITKKVTRINTVFDKQKNKNINITPNCFYYDKQTDIIYIGTKNGIYFSKNGQEQIENLGTIDNRFYFNDNISNITFDPKINTLYFISANYLYIVNFSNNAVEKIAIEKTITNKTLLDNECHITALLIEDGHLWLALYSKGLLQYNIANRKSVLYTHTIPNANYITTITNNINVFGPNKFYMSTHGAGIVVFDKTTKIFIQNKALQNHKIPKTIHSIFFTDNIIWASGPGGLTKINCNIQQLTEFEFKPNTSVAKNVTPNKIQVERNNNQEDEMLWVVAYYVGTYRYNVKTKTILTIPSVIQQRFNHQASILNFLIDKNNRLWISSVRDGVTCYDIKADKIIFTETNYDKANKNWPFEIYEDYNGTIWFGKPNGLFRFSNEENKILAETAFNNAILQNKLSLYVEGITSNSSGNIWVSVDGEDAQKVAAIVKYTPNTKSTFILFNEKNNKSKTDAPILLRNLTITNNNELFAIVRGYGLLHFTNADKTAYTYLTKNNSSITNLYSDYVIADKRNNIWLLDANHLFYFAAQNKNFVNINLEDISGENKNISSLHYSKNTDALIISAQNNIIFLTADKNNLQFSKANLIFEECKVFNKLVSNQIVSGQTLTLQHTQNTLSISFALLNYTYSSQNKYYWRLSGVDKEWQISNQNIATYNLLPPGKYTFEVKAMDNNGLWSTKTLVLKIIIKPPFYKTWWFILMVVLALLGITFYLYKLRINKLKQKFALQNKIAIDLHDEVGSTLTSISILSKISLDAMQTAPERAKEMLVKINNQSGTVQQNISDIVWSIRSDNAQGTALSTRFREYANNTLEPLNIDISYHITEPILEKHFDIATKKELLLIFKESINNIVKHANATNVSVNFYTQNNQTILSIQDNGTWKGANTGTGSKSIAERAKALNGTATITQNEIGTLVSIVF